MIGESNYNDPMENDDEFDFGARRSGRSRASTTRFEVK